MKTFVDYLNDGIMPSGIIPRDEYDDYVIERVFSVIYNPDIFGRWLDTMDMSDISCYLDLPEVITTGNPLLPEDVIEIQRNPRYMRNKLQWIIESFNDKQYPYEELIAIFTDWVATSEIVHSNTLSTVH